MSKKNNSATVLAGLLAGAAVGVVLGVLFAPDEGSKTRKKIREKANDLKDQAIDQYGKTAEILKEQYQQVSDKVRGGYDKFINKTSHNIEDTDIHHEMDAPRHQ